MIQISSKVGRAFAAITLAFGSLFWSTPAQASDMTLEEAQAALALAQQEVVDAQEALSSASASVMSASQAVASASADVESSAQSGSLTETFANGVIQTGVQVLLNGSTPIASTGNPYLGKNSFTANVTSGVIYVNQYPADFEIKPPSPATYVEFYTYARNGNQTVTVTFTDNTTDTFINYNGVGNSACPGYECLITYTAPEGKQIQSLYFPSDFDIFMIDNVTFTTEVYNDDLVQILNDAIAAYDQALVEEGAAQARYDLAVLEVARLEQLVIDLTPPAEPDWWQVQWDEGQEVDIYIMDEGLVFTSVTAWYGSPTDDSCGVDVTEILTEIVVGNNAASWIADNELFGDPCSGVIKVLRFAATVGQATVEEEPTESPTVSPEPTESPTVSPEPIVPEPSPEPSPDTTPEPQPAPEPEPQPIPEPTPEPTPEPQPVPVQPSEPEPVVPVQPEPSVEPEPVVSETPSPEPTPSPSETEEPVVQETTSPKPTPSPTATPTPTATATPTPSVTPSPVQTSPAPTPSPTPTPEPTPSIEPEPIIPNDIEEAVSELLNVDVAEITPEQGEALKELAYEAFETAEPGSEEYDLALEALALAAEADDVELPEELAAIPLLGDVAGAALEVFNNVGNIGADMAPETREKAEKTVIASVIAAQAAIGAVQAATSAATAAASTASSGATRRN